MKVYNRLSTRSRIDLLKNLLWNVLLGITISITRLSWLVEKNVAS